MKFGIRKIMLLIVFFGFCLCFFSIDRNGPYARLDFNPGVAVWYRMMSPAGEQSGFAINNGRKTLVSFEWWNGGVFVNFNYNSYDPDHITSGYWLKSPTGLKPSAADQPYFPTVGVDFPPLLPPVPDPGEAPPVPDAPVSPDEIPR